MAVLTADTASAIDEAVTSGAEHAFCFLEQLVAAPSVLGDECPAQELVLTEFARLGFSMKRVPIRDDVALEPTAGIPRIPYEGRYSVAGRRGTFGRPSLLLNGHIDVAPTGDMRFWDSNPFTPLRKNGWLVGRGAGDMKAGLAMAALAVAALSTAYPQGLEGPLSLVSVIEEECTGNGTLATMRAGYLADAVIVLEPTDLKLALGGIGVLWLDIEVEGLAGHVDLSGQVVNALEAAMPVITALSDLEDRLNAGQRPRGGPSRFAVNIGTIHGGDWPSSVPSVLSLGVRMGFPSAWSVGEAEQQLRDAVDAACANNPWLKHHPPVIRQAGLRAAGYRVGETDPFVQAFVATHTVTHGSPPGVVYPAWTTDARFYVNLMGCPAICYGPRSKNLHGANEGVELASVIEGARTLARFIAEWPANLSQAGRENGRRATEASFTPAERECP